MSTPSLFFSPTESVQQDWFAIPDEGQLSLDVFREGNALIIRSTVAGVTPEDIDIAVHGDMLTIRGERHATNSSEDAEWFYEECHWGKFSRSLILPVEVYAERAEAQVKNGILEIRIPIRESEHRISIRTH